jgi:hypothetical protein
VERIFDTFDCAFFVVKVEREIENKISFCIMQKLIDVIFGLRFL